jgi:anti-sigma-K factor RskA
MSSIEAHHVTDSLPAYVLDAVTAAERRQVEGHLALCPSCRAELTHLQQIAADLPLALPQADPPPELKHRLMQSIHSRKLAQLSSVKQATFVQNLGSFFLRRWPVLGIALIILLALGNLVMWRQLYLTTQNNSTAMRVVTLTNTQFSPGAIGTLVMSPDGHYSTLVVSNLGALQPGKQYQVWLIKGAMHTSAGLFSVDSSGYASLDIIAPQSFQQYDAIGISIEPDGGSPIPTGMSVLHGYLFR